jgi:hypothetical protein
VTFLPSLNQTGHVLLAGRSGHGGEVAAGEFLTTERWVTELDPVDSCALTGTEEGAPQPNLTDNSL